jgi:hypothetical protein
VAVLLKAARGLSGREEGGGGDQGVQLLAGRGEDLVEGHHEHKT